MSRFSFIIVCTMLWICTLCAPGFSEGVQTAYVLKPTINLRNQPRAESDKVASLTQNTSLYILDSQEGWTNVLTHTGLKGWVRNDLKSDTIIRIHKNEHTLVVTTTDGQILSVRLTPGKRGLTNGRYFLLAGKGGFSLSWPNRRDLQHALLAGKMTYPIYKKAILAGPDKAATNQLSICQTGSKQPSCTAFLDKKDYTQLAAIIPHGARIEVYENEAQDNELNGQDSMSARILAGGLKQLKYPAVGLRPNAKLPGLSYPNGDIQPDFAAPADIITRAVRFAGADLQPLVHEDILLHSKRYAELDLGSDHAASHRNLPVLQTFFAHNSLGLSTDCANDPYSFMAGDIVFIATDTTMPDTPTAAGIVTDTFDSHGLPLILTIGGMGQHTGKKDLLSHEYWKVIGHFRMLHLFDYQ